MLIEHVKELTPHQRFFYWMEERQKIYLRKNYGLTELTTDEILAKYHFTNVQRENDKVSKYLFESFYSKHLEGIWGIILIARFINNPETLKLIHNRVRMSHWDEAYNILKDEQQKGTTIFRSAYLQPEIPGKTRLDKIFKVLLPQVLALDIPTRTLADASKTLQTIKYLGDFIAGQMVLDASVFIDGEWADKSTFAPVGPGSIRGIQRLNQNMKLKVDDDVFQRTIFDLTMRTGLRAMDIEHALCEWDKYERILWDEGSYKRFYKK